MSTGRGRSEKAFSTLLLRMYTLHLDFSAVLKVHTTPRGVLLSMSMESVHVFVIHHTSEVHTAQYILNSDWKPYL